MQSWHHAKKVICEEGIVVAPTDTIFGILGSAFSKKTVARIYKLKERDLDKPFIILITKIESLKDFGIGQYAQYSMYFKPKTSVVLPIKGNRFAYLHRKKYSLAFRMVSKRNKNLYTLIQTTGPLVAPSANPQGLEPARSAIEAKKYFGKGIDFYISGTKKVTKPSTIISLTEGAPTIIRK